MQARKKSEVERQLSNKELDVELSKVQFANKKSAVTFHNISQQTWFRQYSKGSKSALNKMLKKVRSGIRHNKYGDSLQNELDDGWKQYLKPKKPKTKGEKKLKVQKKKIEKEQTKIIQDESKKQKKTIRKTREKVKKQERKAPSGRKYSNTELHEGINSKRAIAWRKKNGIKENDK